MDSTKFSKPISLKRIQLDDGFWKPEMELVRKEVIPYQWENVKRQSTRGSTKLLHA